jgi:uncharacterized protein (DUF1697 family)
VSGRARPKTYVALIRGINVGGHKRVAMEDLRTVFRSLGCDDVRTYVQSGNVLFRSPDTPAHLVRAAEDRIEGTLGLDVAVLIRTKEQLARIVKGNPFLAAGADPAKLHVMFLAARPDSKRSRDVSGTSFDGEELHVQGLEIYLHYPGGYGRSKLSNAYLEKQLAVKATTRNWKTVTTLADLASA